MVSPGMTSVRLQGRDHKIVTVQGGKVNIRLADLWKRPRFHVETHRVGLLHPLKVVVERGRRLDDKKGGSVRE